MRSIRWTSLALLASCSASAPAAPNIPEWKLGSTPAITIGAAESEPGHELATVSGARMQRGVIVVANSGSYELQRFDSTGKPLGFEGRKGKGPGEFIGIIRLSAAPGDSLYVFDSENRRWSVHDGTGRYARTLPGSVAALASPVWPYHRMIVRSPAGVPVPSWALAVIDSEPEARPGSRARQAMFDDLGFLWLQDSAGASAWTIHANEQLAVGRAVLPDGFALLQVGRDFVLGIEKDTTELEVLRVYHLARPDRLPTPAASPAGLVAPTDSLMQATMRVELSNVTTAQEMFYSNYSAYTGAADSLGIKLASGAELVILAGDKRHWVGFLYHRASRTTCVVSVGFAAEGWLDGTPLCGR